MNHDDPLKFDQIVKGDDSALVSIDPSGHEDAILMDWYRFNKRAFLKRVERKTPPSTK